VLSKINDLLLITSNININICVCVWGGDMYTVHYVNKNFYCMLDVNNGFESTIVLEE